MIDKQLPFYSQYFKDIRSVLFDIDWTLITFGEAKRAAVNRAVKDMVDAGLPLSPEEAKWRIYQIYKEKGIEYQLVFDDLLVGFGLSRTQKNRIWATAVNGYRETRNGMLTTYPYAIPTLGELSRRGYLLGAVTDAPEKESWLRIHHTNLDPYLKVVVTFDEDKIKKPDPSSFRKALIELRLNPEEVVMVGDNPMIDLAGAKQVGMKTIWAKYGLQDVATLDKAEKLVFYMQQQDTNDRKQIPDAEINSLRELQELLPLLVQNNI